MKIVALDSYAMNPGDLSWEPLETLGEFICYDRTGSEDVVSCAEDAEVILTNKVVLDRETLETLPALKLVSVTATGYNVVDLDAAAERGVVVCNVPAYSTDSVAQMVFAHILNLTSFVSLHADRVRKGRWATSQDFCFMDAQLVELSGKTMGVVGWGAIGQSVAALAKAFGMKIIVSTRTVPQNELDGVGFVSQDELFSQSDIISLHCPLTDATRNLVNRERLGLMKKSAILINTGRGPLLDEQAVADALNSGQIAAAGLDVLSSEPPAEDNPLLKAKNCFITPHIAWATRESRQRLLDVTAENVAAYAKGAPQNVVGGAL